MQVTHQVRPYVLLIDAPGNAADQQTGYQSREQSHAEPWRLNKTIDEIEHNHQQGKNTKPQAAEMDIPRIKREFSHIRIMTQAVQYVYGQAFVCGD